MWRQAAAKLLSPWSARLPSSGNLSTKRQDVFPLHIATGNKRVEPEPEPAVMKYVARPKTVVAIPLWSSSLSCSSVPASKERQEKTGYKINELVGGDFVDYDFINGPFGTEEKPAVMKSCFDHQIAGCRGPDEAEHEGKYFWLHTGEISVCPLCSQHFTLECVGVGGYPGRFD